MFGPEWVEAGADAGAVVMKGIGMVGNKDKPEPAQPPAQAVIVHTFSKEAAIYCALIIAAALLLAALAHGAYVHHGLTHMA